MPRFETLAATHPEARRVSAAFYSFLKGCSGDISGEACMSIESLPGGERITIRLWSDDILRDFERHLGACGLTDARTPSVLCAADDSTRQRSAVADVAATRRSVLNIDL